jgi:hypothetical protein
MKLPQSPSGIVGPQKPSPQPASTPGGGGGRVLDGPFGLPKPPGGSAPVPPAPPPPALGCGAGAFGPSLRGPEPPPSPAEHAASEANTHRVTIARIAALQPAIAGV